MAITNAFHVLWNCQRSVGKMTCPRILPDRFIEQYCTPSPTHPPSKRSTALLPIIAVYQLSPDKIQIVAVDQFTPAYLFTPTLSFLKDL